MRRRPISRGRWSGVDGAWAGCRGDVFLRGGFSATGLVDLTGSVIKGQLSCIGGQFDGAGGAALMGHGLDVGGDVFMRGGFDATGLVGLNGSVIKGQLSCIDGRFDGAGGAAFMAHWSSPKPTFATTQNWRPSLGW